MPPPLHANSDIKEKHRTLASNIGHKVIVATNVAETSLTFPGVKFVINYGVEKNPPALKTVLASKSLQLQREGRSGRDVHGICLMMMHTSAFDMLPELRVPLPSQPLALLRSAREYIDSSNDFEIFALGLPSPPTPELCAASIEEPVALEIGAAMATGAFLGVGQPFAVVLAASTIFLSWRRFYRGMMRKSTWSILGVADRAAKVKSLPRAPTLSGSWLARSSGQGVKKSCGEVLDAVAELRSLATTLGDTDEAWLEKVWPLVDFSFCSGYRLNVAVRSRGQLFWTPSGRSVIFSKKSVVEVDAIHGVLYTSAGASPSMEIIIMGLHRASPLSFLTLGGKIATEIKGAFVLDDTLEMSYRCNIPPDLLGLRSTFVSLLSDFFKGRREHQMQAQLFKELLCQNTGSVFCQLSHRRAPCTSAPNKNREATGPSLRKDPTGDQGHPRD